VVAEHQDSLLDFNSTFLRQLAPKVSKNKLDSRFQIFQEVCEADIELEDCSEIIDFTRCSYSINLQDQIHLLVKNGKGETEIR
jgi:hypothetical protein